MTLNVLLKNIINNSIFKKDDKIPSVVTVVPKANKVHKKTVWKSSSEPEEISKTTDTTIAVSTIVSKEKQTSSKYSKIVKCSDDTVGRKTKLPKLRGYLD